METQIAKSEGSLIVTHTFQAPVKQVYRAWTEAKMMNGWFHPDPRIISTCRLDLQVGGSYEIQMHGEQTYTVGGVYREIVPKEKLVFTWQWQGEDTAEMLITVHFKAINDSETELTLIHEQFPSVEERDSHAQGWEGTFEQLQSALR